ncbi:AAA family ATPase [Rhodococcus sp. (in: high G+C Gram-positive bacteria)]|uniref:ATP-dependent nuclease n=1 Tax=Rhodococcus sp. TaxID=1831 RepID=UPI00257A37DF|nr:AAA family ATPase [Rhodococcus sp. (in: high G+C Gram-positive bacteria)]MBQ9055541.1 AAA family ATPase [Rhodococcus sp. (in: high G+C Gram-positive bacteria)]
MHIQQLAVSNHSRLADFDIALRAHLVVVGPNDVGKSSLLRCLDLLLGCSTTQLYQRLSVDDFQVRDQPLIVRATLTGLSSDDKALFPDEPTVDPATGETTLVLQLSVTIDDTETLSIQRTAPTAGTGRQLTRTQLAGIGWTLLSATATSRDLRDDRRSTVDDILQSVDLGAEQAGFDALTQQLITLLGSSKVLGDLRSNLATQLSKALPHTVGRDDLSLTPGASIDNDVLSDVRLLVQRNGQPRSLVEQSDGTRALYAIALYDLVSSAANMVAIDEPEIHLHPTSQRSLAKLLQSSGNQKILATHSADIVGAFPPDCIVSIRAGGTIVQPDEGFLSDDERMMVRWWVRDKLEPLTARAVIAVEGISDRIILERVCELTGRDLDRLGVSVIETDGCGDMGPVAKLFGTTGFDIPISLLIDDDAKSKTASALGVPETDLEQHAVWISDPDLEAEYLSALGADAVWNAISASHLFNDNERANCTATGPGQTRTEADVATFCRKRKHGTKVKAAMVVAPLLDEQTARNISSVEKLLSTSIDGN